MALAGLQITETPTLLIDDFSEGVEDSTFGPAYMDPYIDWSYLVRSEGPSASGRVEFESGGIEWSARAVHLRHLPR